jgi:hypothetical protein
MAQKQAKAVSEEVFPQKKVSIFQGNPEKYWVYNSLVDESLKEAN